MERRQFLFSLAALPLAGFVVPKFPQIPVDKFKIAPPSNPEFENLWDLRFYKLPDDPNSFMQNSYKIAKGPYSVIVHGFEKQIGDDLIDCHGLCATFEWADLIKQELEYGEEGLKKLWSLSTANLPWDAPTTERDYWLKKLKRVEITKVERAKLILLCHKFRGEHNCCLPHKRTIWKYAERAIHKLEPTWKLEIHA